VTDDQAQAITDEAGRGRSLNRNGFSALIWFAVLPCSASCWWMPCPFVGEIPNTLGTIPTPPVIPAQAGIW